MLVLLLSYVWRQYSELFQGAHEWTKEIISAPFFMAHGKDLNIEWQNRPEAVLTILERYGAHMYYQANFVTFKPKIRLAMATWLFVEKSGLTISDDQGGLLVNERKTYLSLLDSYVKVRKSQDEHLMFLHRLKMKPEVVVLEDFSRNEMPKTDVQSGT